MAGSGGNASGGVRCARTSRQENQQRVQPVRCQRSYRARVMCSPSRQRQRRREPRTALRTAPGRWRCASTREALYVSSPSRVVLIRLRAIGIRMVFRRAAGCRYGVYRFCRYGAQQRDTRLLRRLLPQRGFTSCRACRDAHRAAPMRTLPAGVACIAHHKRPRCFSVAASAHVVKNRG